jgi:hypothetical protein
MLVYNSIAFGSFLLCLISLAAQANADRTTDLALATPEDCLHDCLFEYRGSGR